MADPQPTITAVLNFSRLVLVLAEQCQAIVLAMTGNAYFASPDPSLAAVTDAINAVLAAQMVAMTRAKGAATTRKLKVKALRKLMRHLRDYVQQIADSMPGEEAKVILSAGMGVKTLNPRKPRVFAALHGAVSGSALVEAPPTPGQKSVFWQWSGDQKSWNDAGPTTKSSIVITGLTPGLTYYFRYRVFTTKGMGDWSQIVSLMVK